MAQSDARPLTRERLRTPQAAAYAGIVFAILIGISMLLIQTSIPLSEPFQADWITDHRTRLQVAVGVVPFGGIAFLWFMGTIRDRVGDLEDKFFSTVFFGSGLLFIGGLFLWVTILGAVLASAAASPDTWSDSGSFVFGMSLIKILGGVVTLRMAGVFMFSSGTIWLRTKAMPRWMVWITYGLSVTLLVGGASVRAFRLVFPLWVLVVSLLILRVHDRFAQDG